MEFSRKLSELREAAGMTQPGLAEASGVPLSTIRGYEQGRRQPSLAHAKALAAAMNLKCTAFDEPEAEPRPVSRGKLK